MEDIIINDDNKLAVEIEKTGKKEKKPKKHSPFIEAEESRHPVILRSDTFRSDRRGIPCGRRRT